MALTASSEYAIVLQSRKTAGRSYPLYRICAALCRSLFASYSQCDTCKSTLEALTEQSMLVASASRGSCEIANLLVVTGREAGCGCLPKCCRELAPGRSTCTSRQHDLTTVTSIAQARHKPHNIQDSVSGARSTPKAIGRLLYPQPSNRPKHHKKGDPASIGTTSDHGRPLSLSRRV